MPRYVMDSDEEGPYDSGNESSGNDVDYAMDMEQARAQLDSDEYPFDCLSTDKILKDMNDTIIEVNTVVRIPSTTTRILLNYFKWDKEKLMEKYYDGDREQLFVEARVINPFTTNIVEPKIYPRDHKEKCKICFSISLSSFMKSLDCGHRFCRDCWCAYLTNKIMEEGIGLRIACAAHNCDYLIDDKTVMNLVREPRVRQKFQYLITNSFVECNRLLRWCPAPDCNYAIKVQYVESRPVKCICGHTFCFFCGENWHDPVKCQFLKKWIKKCDDDSETSNWIAANTKECPKCNVTIEKFGGCNHMICQNQNCKADFCWVCLGPWDPHGSSWYSCNRYDEEDSKAARNAQEKSRSALQRYLFYCNRYMNHMQSLKFEHKLYEKMENLHRLNISWFEIVKRAVDILCQCRQTLMYTYVFAYYVKKTNQSVIFEDNQRDLESATETLSEYLERDITLENLTDIKQKVQDKYRYCDSRRKVLLGHVHEGYEKEWWECN